MLERANQSAVEGIPTGRQAKKRARTAGYLYKLRCWYIFPAHQIIVAIFAIFVFRGVNDKVFAPSTDALLPSNGKLRQTDVTSLVSAGLVLVRSTLTTSTGLAVQRCLFILLEKHGITFSEIGRLFTFNLGPWGKSMYRIGCAFILMFFFPAQISAPLLSGAVSWHPDIDFSSSNFTVPLSVPGSNDNWGWFEQWPAEHRPIAKELAAEMYTLHDFSASAYSYTESEHDVVSRRYVPSLNYPESLTGNTALPTNTTIDSVTMPYFEITNFQWINADKDYVNHSLSFDNGLFNFTSTGNALLLSLPGLLGIVRDRPFKWTQEFPKGEVLNENFTIITYVGRPLSGKGCESVSGNNIFGSLPTFRLGQVQLGPFTQCYILANATITAGLVDCKDSPIISRGLIQCSPANRGELAVYANPLNEAIMQMIPELTHTMANLNISQAPTWGEESLKGYVTGTLSAAYQASWNSMVERFNSTSATTEVQLPSSVLRARVDSKRVCAWIGLHLLTFMAAALLVIMQRRCVNEAVVDLVAACLLTDPTDILRTPEGSQICTLGAIPGESSRKIGDIMVREKVSDDRSVHRRVLWRKEKVVEERMSMLESGEIP